MTQVPPGYKYKESVDSTKVTSFLQELKNDNAIPGIPNSQGQTPIFVPKDEEDLLQ